LFYDPGNRDGHGRTTRPGPACSLSVTRLLNAFMKPVYKICPQPLWRDAENVGFFDGAPIDVHDGYLHFSTASQVRETAARHFAGQSDLLLIAIDSDKLGEALRYEASRGGDLFPHLYAPLPLSAVLWAKPLPLGPDGYHIFPDLVP
jgi:uncharacterized protein (DUF952 family)